jgi:hypothetical protein
VLVSLIKAETFIVLSSNSLTYQTSEKIEKPTLIKKREIERLNEPKFHSTSVKKKEKGIAAQFGWARVLLHTLIKRNENYTVQWVALAC